MSHSKKTVAVIGCGKAVEGQVGWAIGHMHGGGYRNCGSDVRLLGVDLDPDNLNAFGDKFEVAAEDRFLGTDLLYASVVPDVVSICTWPGLHAPMALEAMDKGVKGLIIEKPLALNVGEINAIRAKAEAVGAVVCVAHQRRMEPYFQTLKSVVASGKLGDSLRVDAHVGGSWDILSWTTHWFDMANFMFGAAPQSVLAGMELGAKRIYGHAAEGDSIIYAEYGEGREAFFLTGPGGGCGFRVIGSKGFACEKEGQVLVATEAGVETIDFVDCPHGGSINWLVAELLAAMEGGPEPICSLQRCGVATEMAYAAHESARTGQRVTLPMAAQYAPMEVVQHPVKSILQGQRALLYADSHFGSGGREGLAEAIEHLTGEKPEVIDAETSGLTADALEQVDILYIYHTQTQVSPETESALNHWVDGGKPLVIVHAGLGAWPEWGGYQKWCGLIWEWNVSIHPHEATTLDTVEGNPLRFTYSQAWLPKDEVFVKLKQIDDVEIGLTALLKDGTRYPAAWRSKAHRNIGAWMPGHNRDSWNVPAMRQGLAELVQSVL